MKIIRYIRYIPLGVLYIFADSWTTVKYKDGSFSTVEPDGRVADPRDAELYENAINKYEEENL